MASSKAVSPPQMFWNRASVLRYSLYHSSREKELLPLKPMSYWRVVNRSVVPSLDRVDSTVRPACSR